MLLLRGNLCTDIRTLHIHRIARQSHSLQSFIRPLIYCRSFYLTSSSFRSYSSSIHHHRNHNYHNRNHNHNHYFLRAQNPSVSSRPHSTMSSASAVSMIESAKRTAAKAAVADHYPTDAKYVGIGSGSTVVYVVEAIKELGTDTSNTKFVPTGYQSKQLIVSAGLLPVEFDSVPEGTVLDVAFDGADEVDDDLNCIKGGGACLFQEKIVALQSKKFICVADSRKLQSRLLSSWKYIPIEVAPIAVYRVLTKLKELGSVKPVIRLSTSPKQGPLKTDQDFFLIDAPFPAPLLTKQDVAAGKDGSGKDGIWEVEALSREIRAIAGVLEAGIFSGETGPEVQTKGKLGGEKPVAAYFGKPDGSVAVRKAPQ